MSAPPINYKPRRFYRAKIEILYVVAADPALEPAEVEKKLKVQIEYEGSLKERAIRNLWVEEIPPNEFYDKYLWEDISIGED